MGKNLRETPTILGTRVDPTSYEDATRKVLEWALAEESRYVCVANVHVIMEAYDDPTYRAVLNSADLVTPDGMPLVWMLRKKGFRGQERVYGPELTLRVCSHAAARGIPVGFYGSRSEVLEALKSRLKDRYPKLDVAFSHSPPFRPLSLAEDLDVVERVHASGARILFVGLGCPKQERWMAEHKGRIKAVMLGVGAAFNLIAGFLPQAPEWMQRAGLEWVYRLIQEPTRLAPRYFKHNPRFAILAAVELLREVNHS